jgi:chromosome segregation ATPase
MSDANIQRDEEAEFEAGFSSILSDQAREAPSHQAADTDTDPSEGGSEDKHGAEAQAEDKPDPFASLPPEVRELLADVPRLKMDLERANRQLGQIPALQSRIDRLTAQATPREPAPQPKLEKVERLRTELPEIADALDEIVQSVGAQREAKADEQQPLQRTADAPDPVNDAMAALDEARSTWRQDLFSAEFQLWLTRQPEDRRKEVTGTKRADVILKALKEFDQAKPAAPSPNPQASSRTTRMAAAVAPSGTSRRSRAAVDDEEAEFEAGFRSIRGG